MVAERQLGLDRHREDADDLPVDEVEDVGEEQDERGRARPGSSPRSCSPPSPSLELHPEAEEDLARIAVEGGDDAFPAEAGDDVAGRALRSGTPVTGLTARNW